MTFKLVCFVVSLNLICAMSFLSFGEDVVGNEMTKAQAALLTGAECGYIEDGGGSDYTCAGWCYFGGDGIESVEEQRSTSGNCLDYVDDEYQCPCGGDYLLTLGGNSCVSS